MRSILLAGVVTVALAGLACGCSATPALVANPAYQMWAGFEPGSSATLEGSRITGEQIEQVRITQRLVEADKDRVIVERTVKVLSVAATQPSARVKVIPATQPVVTRVVEPRMIQPTEHLQTRPGAVTKVLPSETIELKGLALTCCVIDVEVNVTFGGPLPTSEHSHMRRWLNSAVPGGTVRISVERQSTSHYLQVAVQLVDYKVARRAQP